MDTLPLGFAEPAEHYEPGTADRIARGVCRRLNELGYRSLLEFRLGELSLCFSLTRGHLPPRLLERTEILRQSYEFEVPLRGREHRGFGSSRVVGS